MAGDNCCGVVLWKIFALCASGKMDVSQGKRTYVLPYRIRFLSCGSKDAYCLRGSFPDVVEDMRSRFGGMSTPSSATVRY